MEVKELQPHIRTLATLNETAGQSGGATWQNAPFATSNDNNMLNKISLFRRGTSLALWKVVGLAAFRRMPE